MKIRNWNLPRFLLFVLAIQAIAGTTLILDIPVVRQISGFLFLAFIPGLVLLRVFNLEKTNLTETILFSVGLSLAYLMLIGVLVNELGSLNLISKPLSTESLALIINASVTLMCILSCLKNKDTFSFADEKGLKRFWLILPHFILPILSVIGVLLITIFNSNLLLISVFIAISIIFVLSMSTSKLSSHYPLIIISIALALLLSTTLVSMYMYGTDINIEFSGFTPTQNMSFWNRQDYTHYDDYASISMVSVTVLPTIFSNLLNLDGAWIFKIVFPIIFSLVPLALYQLYQIHWGKKVAFLSVIFFMANNSFFQVIVTNAKQMVAEFFYVLLFLVILKECTNSQRSKWIIVLFFSFALLASHYGTNYIFLFMIFSTAFLGKIFSKNNIKKIKTTIIASSLCLTFLWYIYVVRGPFEKLQNMIRHIFENFASEFLLSESRGDPVQLALGMLESPSALHYVGRVIFNITTVLILVGFIYFIIKWKKGKIDTEYGLITFLNMGLLLAAIIIPRFAGFLEMGRLYHIVLLFLSPLFVIGGEFLCMSLLNIRKGKKPLNSKADKKKSYCLLLISIMLVPFFLFQAGVFYEVTDDPVPSSISLSKYKLEDYYYLNHESDVFSAMWLSKYGDVENMLTYSDTVSLIHVLTSYSTIQRSMISIISNTSTERGIYPGIFSYAIREVTKPNMSYIYLRQYNVKNEMVMYNTKTDIEFKISEVPILNSTGVFINKIYSNSDSEIYTRVP